MLIVSFLAPSSDRAGMEVGMLKFAGVQDLAFSLKYNMPLAEIFPIDGRMQGGDLITIRAAGVSLCAIYA